VPTDWVVYWMIGPAGLLIIGIAAALSVFLWSIVLGHASTRVGIRPLLIGYACGASGLLLCSFLQSFHEFSNRASEGVLQEAQRWSIVPGWTLYLSVLSLIYALPLATIVGVPTTALLLRMGKFTYASMAAKAVVIWLSLAILLWAFPTNAWHRIHRLARSK
jgi:hypothetical protein